MSQTSNLTDTDEMLELLFAETAPCEMPLHGSSKSRLHGGDGKWYIALRCPLCTASTSALVCEPFRNFLLAMVDDFKSTCGHCKKEITMKDALTSMIRRG